MTPLLKLSLAWCIGIGLATLLDLPIFVVAVVALVMLAGAYLYRREPLFGQATMLAFVCCLGLGRMYLAEPAVSPAEISFYNDRTAPLTVIGTVADEPDVRDNYTNLRVEVEQVLISDTVRTVGGTLLVRAPRFPERQYGDRLEIYGLVETPPIFDTFSYKDYLARFGIYSMIRRPRIDLLEATGGHPLWAAMFHFKGNASATINRLLSEPYASLLNGILLGIETGIPRDLYDLFNLTGTSHIIVISGSNISLVAGIFLFLGQHIFGKRTAPPIAIVAIVLYTLLVGADAAVQRAAVMGIIWVIAIWSGRPGWGLNSLAASALFLSLINPLILWDIGFQLSFFATLGLIILVPPLQVLFTDWLRRWLKREELGLAMALLNELVIITLAAQIITGPLVVYYFGRFSLVSLLTNLLILPVQPPIMIVGGIATLVGMIWLPLGQLIGWFVWIPLAWSVWMVELTAQLPYGSLELGRVPFWLVTLWYIVIFIWAWVYRVHNQPTQTDLLGQPQIIIDRLPDMGNLTTRLLLGGATAATLLIWLAVSTLPDGRLHVTFLDVGQGDAILVTAPNGQQMLIDGGPSITTLNWRLGQNMPFWDRSLDLVVNTHPDMDHLGGLVSILDRFTVDEILVADATGRSNLYRQWLSELEEYGARPIVAEAGMTFNLGDEVHLTVLSPGPWTDDIEDPNNHSVVLRLEMGEVSFLLTGDIEAEVEARLIEQNLPLTTTVLKSPHHGSGTSSSDPFLSATQAQLVVIQVGENRFGHPTEDVLARYQAHGLTVLRNDRHGTITLSTDGHRLWAEVDRSYTP